MTTATKTTVEILESAKDLLKDGHRIQFATFKRNDDRSYSFCPLGAISYAQGYNPEALAATEFSAHAYEDSPPVQFLAHAIDIVDPDVLPNLGYTALSNYQYNTAVHTWNDEQSDDAKVLEAFDTAIELAKAAGADAL